MEPTTTAALISGGASILGGLFGSSGQSRANKANLKIAREQMAFQESNSFSKTRRGFKPCWCKRYNVKYC